MNDRKGIFRTDRSRRYGPMRWGAPLAAMLVVLTACASVERPASAAPGSSTVAPAAADAAAEEFAGQVPVGADSPAAEAVSAALALETFDSAWSRIHTTYYDSTFGGIDWRSVRAELRPRAAAAETAEELRTVIRQMLARLGESHFVLLPAEMADAVVSPDGGAPWGDVGFDLRWVEDAVTVTRIAAGSAADVAGVRPGWILESVDGRKLGLEGLEGLPEEGPATSIQLRMLGAALHALAGEPGDRVRAAFRNGADERVEVELVRRSPPGEPVRIGSLPVIHAQAEGTRLALEGGGCAGVVRFNAWVAPLAARIHSAVDDASHCAGIVVDLRGNVGGMLGMLSGVSGAFLDEPARLGTMRTRTQEMRIVANPRRATADGRRAEPFGGAVAILVDDWTVSAAELFTAGMQGIGRARVFGVPSAGEALPAHLMRLPSGDVMMYAVADYEGPDGRRVEGRGVVPDIRVPYSRSGLLAGRDLQLEAALEWIRSGG